MKVSIEELHSIFLQNRTITTDSRQIVPGSIFFALKGDNFDGNQYAHKAIESGAAFAVIDDPAFENDKTLLVENVLLSLQQLAHLHRNKFNIPVIAITGSNGKTTTKELINSVLCQRYNVTATIGNLNNHIGVPLTLLRINDQTEIAVIEMGANHEYEIDELCKIAGPTHGLITNIGKAHLGGFGGYGGVIRAKSELYNWLRENGMKAFINADNPLLMRLSEGIEQILYGTTQSLFVAGKIIENTSNLELDWVTANEIHEIKTNLVGEYNFENVMAAICLGVYFEVEPKNILSAISNYVPSNSRSQSVKTARNSVVLDAYNANPTSMEVAIKNFRQAKSLHKMVILGDMLELGEESLAEHLGISGILEESDFEKVILVGPDFMQVAGSKFTCFANSEMAYQWLAGQQITGFSILVKGSRGIRMEKVLDAL